MSQSKKRAYVFRSVWQIAAPAEQVADYLLKSDQWVNWWPGLEQVRLIKGHIGVGGTFTCVWRSALGYRLHMVATITEYQPGKYIVFTATGDLEGEGRLQLQQAGHHASTAIINWHVDVNRRWMRATEWMLRPMFVLLHHQIMRAGEQGLNKALRTAQ